MFLFTNGSKQSLKKLHHNILDIFVVEAVKKNEFICKFERSY